MISTNRLTPVPIVLQYGRRWPERFVGGATVALGLELWKAQEKKKNFIRQRTHAKQYVHHYQFVVVVLCLVLVCFTYILQGWGLLFLQFYNFLHFFIFPIFQNNKTNGYQYDIMFIFDQCHCSWAAETPGKCERD